MDGHEGHDHSELDKLTDAFERAKERAKGKNIHTISWGDTLMNLAAGLILLRLGSEGHPGASNMDAQMKAASTVFHVDTFKELVRLAEILNATEGFEDKSIVHPSEVDGDAPIIDDTERAKIDDTFKRLMGGLDNLTD